MTRRARRTFGRRRTVSILALAVSLWLLTFAWSSSATVATSPPSTFDTISTPALASTTTAQPAQTEFRATGSGGRTVVRIGSLLFAAGSIVTYVAAGIRRRPVRPPITGDDDESE